ncbi:hypothetical protein CUZ56_02450 [Saezia sanguinis]|uniref:Uncharacterized protein n=1 Tax=Saezia sanguinis TaxID=1965230 RepID=A0A433SAU0_9BURK|nr:hypothetical protein [Saezia sanguinis]RUS65850.1 hypothetical protein CUZ56_02450 [Saezia sanguinis]
MFNAKMPSTNYIHGISMDKAFSGATARLLHKINDGVICLSAKCAKVPVFGGIEKGGPVAAVIRAHHSGVIWGWMTRCSRLASHGIADASRKIWRMALVLLGA